MFTTALAYPESLSFCTPLLLFPVNFVSTALASVLVFCVCVFLRVQGRFAVIGPACSWSRLSKKKQKNLYYVFDSDHEGA